MNTLIITFQNEINYGAVLQAYALQRYVSGLSHVDVCNLSFNLNKTTVLRPDSILTLYKKVVFKKFQKKYLCLTKKIKNIEELNRIIYGYDKIIVGSDQVFAFDIIKDYSDIFYLNFPHQGKYSYAASFGNNELIVNNIIDIKDKLSSFSKVSLREESSKNLLIKNGIQCERCVDPTLLLDEKQYIDDFRLSKKEQKYILVYMPTIDPDVIEAVNKIKEATGLDVVCFNARNRFGKNTKCAPCASPAEFLDLFYNAEYVVTDSFHGTCFSIIFKKKFISVLNRKKGIRQKELLELYGLEDRIYNKRDGIQKYLRTPKIDLRGNKVIMDSKKYLKSIYEE